MTSGDMGPPLPLAGEIDVCCAHRLVAPEPKCPLSRLRERVGVRAGALTLTPTLSRKRERGTHIAARHDLQRPHSGSWVGRPLRTPDAHACTRSYACTSA